MADGLILSAESVCTSCSLWADKEEEFLEVNDRGEGERHSSTRDHGENIQIFKEGFVSIIPGPVFVGKRRGPRSHILQRCHELGTLQLTVAVHLTRNRWSS